LYWWHGASAQIEVLEDGKVLFPKDSTFAIVYRGSQVNAQILFVITHGSAEQV
jgi:hypothetical protein